MTILALMVAGGFGALARLELGGWVQRRAASDRPWGTFVVNLLGAAALGAVVAGGDLGLAPEVRDVVGTGFLGGFTTFSTWMVAGATLVEERAWCGVAVHVGAQAAVGVAVAAGVRALVL